MDVPQGWCASRGLLAKPGVVSVRFISLENFIRTPRMHEGACALSPCSAASVSINIKDLHMESSDNIISGCGLSSLWQRNATLCLDPWFYYTIKLIGFYVHCITVFITVHICPARWYQQRGLSKQHLERRTYLYKSRHSRSTPINEQVGPVVLLQCDVTGINLHLLFSSSLLIRIDAPLFFKHAWVSSMSTI